MEQLVGNKSAYQTLAAWIDGGRLPHAILLEGAAGSGKKTFARHIAAAVLCEGDAPRPCGICRHCIKVEKGIHPDLLTFGGEGGARSFHIDTVREIRGGAYVFPNEAAAKVYLLRDVQNMSVQAQNALLKIIEEPPKHVVFLLTCENKSNLLETILSRVAVVVLSTPDLEDCRTVLEEKVPGLPSERYQAAALETRGNVGKALALLAEESPEKSRYSEALDTLCAACYGNELDALAALCRYDRDRQGFAVLLGVMRSIAASLLLHEPHSPGEKELKERISALRLGKIIGIIDEIAGAAAGNGNLSLLGNVLCAKIRTAVTDR